MPYQATRRFFCLPLETMSAVLSSAELADAIGAPQEILATTLADPGYGTLLGHREILPFTLGAEAPVATNDAGFHCVNSTRTNVLGASDGA